MSIHIQFIVAAAVAALATTLASCTAETAGDNSPGPVAMTFSIAAADMDSGDSGHTRAAEPMDNNDERLIYNITLLQFRSSGLLLPSSSLFIDYPSGVSSATITASLMPDNGNGYVAILANTGGKDKGPVYIGDDGYLYTTSGALIDNYDSFRKTFLDLPDAGHKSEGKVGLLDSIYMYGTYHGVISQADMPYNIGMARLCTSISVQVVNDTGNDFTGTITVDNAPKRSRIAWDEDSGALPDDCYQSYTEALTVPRDNNVTLYYYMGENLNPATGKATTLTFTDSGTGKKATVTLGHELPDTENRNLSLYRNIQYKITVSLK